MKPALQLVGEAADRALEGVELLVEIGAQPLQLGGFGQILGADLLIVLRLEDEVVGIGIRSGRGRRVLEPSEERGHAVFFLGHARA